MTEQVLREKIIQKVFEFTDRFISDKEADQILDLVFVKLREKFGAVLNDLIFFINQEEDPLKTELKWREPIVGAQHNIEYKQWRESITDVGEQNR